MVRYADFVLAVSEELSGVAESDVDASIERVLASLVGLAGADRGYLFLRSEDGQRVSNTHEWCQPGIEPARPQLVDLPLDAFPWAFTVFNRKELVVDDVSQAPPGPERLEWERERIQSLFCAPLVIHGECVGFIGCDWVRERNPLDEEIRQLVRTAGMLMAGAVARRRTLDRLEHRRSFEDLVLRISSRFISLRADEAPQAFTAALEELARFMRVQSGMVAQLSSSQGLSVRHLYRVAPLKTPPPEVWASLDVGALRAGLAHLRQDELFAYGSLDEAPPAYQSVRRFFESQGVKAVLCSLLVVGGEPWGFLGFSAAQPRTWTDGEQRMVRLAAQVFSNALSRIDAERKEAALQEQLRQTQKLEVVGQLAGGVAHDFNNLLVSITLWSELARRTLAKSPEQAGEAIAEISRAAHRASRLTQQLLTFSRKRPTTVRPLSFERLVNEMFTMLRRLVKESIHIELVTSAEDSIVEGDSAQLEQLLLNLCVNASDAMGDGGTLTIATRRAMLDQAAAVTPWVSPGAHVVLDVIDTGCGIAPENLGRIFEPFFTTKPVGKGTGLGLSTVYAIVRQHSGQVRICESRPGRTHFEVWLPISGRSALAPQDVPSIELPQGKGETVLLAEDDPMVRGAITEVLERAAYRVVVTASGTHALAAFEEAPEVSIAILDAVMPNLSGLETWQILSARRPNLPVLFISGYSASVFPPGFFDGGRYRLLEKPFSPEALLSAVRQAIDGGPTAPP